MTALPSGMAVPYRHIPVWADLCKRVRYRQSTCRLCEEICPENAIQLDPGPVLNERCIACGLCQAACPTEVFQEFPHSDSILIEKINTAASDKGGEGGQTMAVVIHCSQVEPVSDKSIAVACLGALTETCLLGAASAGLGELVLEKGDCARCTRRCGGELFDTALAAFHSLEESLELTQFQVTVREGRLRKATRFTRRALLNMGGADSDAGTPPSSGVAWEPPPSRVEPGGSNGAMFQRPSPGRALFGQLLNRIDPAGEADVATGVDRHWGQLRIDAGGCATCGICVNLCPTGAISRKVDGNRLSHVFDCASCNRCGLCQEACPEQVIDFAPRVALRELCRSAPTPITQIPLRGCAVCGDALPPKEGSVCTTCRKRGLAGRHLPGLGAV